MVGRPCTVCRHKDRLAIELVSAGSVRRHMADHAPRSMERARIAVGGGDLADAQEDIREINRRVCRKGFVSDEEEARVVAWLEGGTADAH